MNPNFLNAGEAYTGTATVSARDVGEGDYYLIVRADGRDDLEEYSGDGDNITVGPLIRITVPPPPDLVVNNVVAPEFAFSGQSMALSWTVGNQGDSSAYSRWDDAVYMSVDDVLDATDLLLDTVPHQRLYQIFRTVSYSGDYESCVGEPEPDPVTDLFLQHPDLNLVQNSFQLLSNLGNRRTVCATTDGFGNVVETVSEVTRYSFEFLFESFLDVDQTYARTVNVQLPIGVSGEFFFFVLTDVNNTVNEFAFDNNNENFDAIATTINLTPPPDLEVIEIEPPDSAEAGREFSFAYTAINAGATRTPNASWRDAFYLSDDDRYFSWPARHRFSRWTGDRRYLLSRRDLDDAQRVVRKLLFDRCG